MENRSMTLASYPWTAFAILLALGFIATLLALPLPFKLSFIEHQRTLDEFACIGRPQSNNDKRCSYKGHGIHSNGQVLLQIQLAFSDGGNTASSNRLSATVWNNR